MKKIAIVVLALALLLGSTVTPVMAGELEKGIDNPTGIALYVIIEVTWNGDPACAGSWTVYGPKWNPSLDGPILATCPGGGPPESCLDMTNYEFKFTGKSVQFDEVMVETVVGTPQAYHVVLYDKDGDGTYTGSLNAAHYFPWAPEPDDSWPILYFDRIDYEITFDEDGNVIDFYYLQYEHKKLE